MMVPFIAGIYSAVEYRLHVEMLSEENSETQSTNNTVAWLLAQKITVKKMVVLKMTAANDSS